MTAMTTVSVAMYGAIALGGLALAVAPLTRSGRTSPSWIRIALWIAGPLCVGWGALGLIRILAWQFLSRDAYRVAEYVQTLCQAWRWAS